MERGTGRGGRLLKKICRGAAAAALLALMTVSAALLAGKYCSDQRGKKEYELIRRLAGIEERKAGEAGEEAVPLPFPDEAGLRQANPDYAGWIFIPGTPVSYPVVYPRNNWEYLDQTFEGRENPCGCLFFEASCPPFSSENTVIYGHNMRSGEMFGSLKKYREEEYLRKHSIIYLFRGGEWTEYQIQKAYLTDSRDKSPYGPGGAAAEKERLTLSTCHGREYRLIIQAERNG